VTVIYLDVLIGLNWIIDYFLLLAAAHLLSRRAKRWRIVLGAALGGVSASLVLAPKVNAVLSFLIHAAVAALMIWITYGFYSARLFFKTLLCFYTVSFSFSGIMYAIWYCAAPRGMIWRNGTVYFNLSPLLLIVLTVVCYLILTLLQKLVGRREVSGRFFAVELTVEGRTVSFRAMLDTGNSLVEQLSGAPVLVAEYDAVQPLIPEALRPVYAQGRVEQVGLLEQCSWQKRFRLVPFSGVGAKSLLPAFLPDKATISGEECETACVAVCRQKLSAGIYRALIPPTLAEAAELRKSSRKSDSPLQISNQKRKWKGRNAHDTVSAELDRPVETSLDAEDRQKVIR